MDIITYALLAGKTRALDTKYSGLAEGFSYKGSAASTAALPATDNTAGDLYTVTGEGNARYLYDGEEWVNLDSDITDIKNAISQLQPTATASDVGKALIVKTVDTQTGKPTGYEYGEAGGQTDIGLSVVNGQICVSYSV